jgi:hypothetical protein
MTQVEHDLSTSALNFKEFSFRSEDGSLMLRNVSKELRSALHKYLVKHYGAVEVQYSEPSLIIECTDVPAESKRPFSVAGLISIWIKEGDFGGFTPFAGDRSESDNLVTVPDEVLSQLQPRTIPSRDAILFLANSVFVEAIAITMIWESIIIELPQID